MATLATTRRHGRRTRTRRHHLRCPRTTQALIARHGMTSPRARVRKRPPPTTCVVAQTCRSLPITVCKRRRRPTTFALRCHRQQITAGQTRTTAARYLRLPIMRAPTTPHHQAVFRLVTDTRRRLQTTSGPLLRLPITVVVAPPHTALRQFSTHTRMMTNRAPHKRATFLANPGFARELQTYDSIL